MCASSACCARGCSRGGPGLPDGGGLAIERPAPRLIQVGASVGRPSSNRVQRSDAIDDSRWSCHGPTTVLPFFTSGTTGTPKPCRPAAGWPTSWTGRRGGSGRVGRPGCPADLARFDPFCATCVAAGHRATLCLPPKACAPTTGRAGLLDEQAYRAARGAVLALVVAGPLPATLGGLRMYFPPGSRWPRPWSAVARPLPVGRPCRQPLRPDRDDPGVLLPRRAEPPTGRAPVGRPSPGTRPRARAGGRRAPSARSARLVRSLTAHRPRPLATVRSERVFPPVR